MSIATVVTRGYGSFGDIAHVVTIGYGISAVNPLGIDTHDGGAARRKHYREEIERKRLQRADIEEIFKRFTVGELPAAVREVVKPYVPRKQRDEPVVEVAKWELMMADPSVMAKLTEEYEIYRAAQDDDDFIVSLMLQ